MQIIPYLHAILFSYLSTITNHLLPHFSRSLNTSVSTDNLSSFIKSHRSLIQQHLTKETYTSTQPTASQRLAWRTVVTSLLNMAVNDNQDCSSNRNAIPDALKGIYTITQVDNGHFCALVEAGTVLREGRREYAKGWGIFVVPAQGQSDERGQQIHLSAPHPVFDLYTAEEATHVFGRTGAKSLFVPGRSRRAFDQETECIVSTGRTKYWKTDTAHDKGEMMFETYKAIIDWQNDSSGGGGASCAYIQFHGKTKETCRREQVFLSAGLGRDAASLSWYTDPAHAHFPIHLLSTHLQSCFPSLNVTTPASPTSSCSLTATKNVVGRLINGVSEDRVCMDSATIESATGLFVHIEQDVELRKSASWDMWVEVLLDVFRGNSTREVTATARINEEPVNTPLFLPEPPHAASTLSLPAPS
ncbi:hypothetical protein APHAL10511_005532 [Amanita phalloides]|nr:hypothetical protein APHAL10511_005532 [Amanita phalloides]